MPRLDPAAGRGADAHPHLAAEPLGEVAVAVDHHRRTCFDGLARQMAVEIEVAGRAVDLDGRAGVARRREEAIPLEVVAVGASGRPVGRVGDDVDQRMRHRPQVARQQAIGRLAGGVVQRREDDVEAGHHRIRQVEAAVRQDVDLAAVQDRQLGIGRPQRLDFPGLLGDALDRQRPARLRRRRVIGDGEVAVAERPRRADHRLGRVAAVAPQRVRVQIALDVGQRDGRRERAAFRERDLVEAVPPLRRDPRQIERGVEIGFGGRRPDAAAAVDDARPASAAGRGRGRARRAAPRARVSRSSAPARRRARRRRPRAG